MTIETTNTDQPAAPAGLLGDLEGLGFDLPVKPGDPTPEHESKPDLLTFERGSVAARAMVSIAQGDPIITVQAPPGGGKTRTIVQIAVALANRMNVDVTIACPTREQTAGLARRIVEFVPPPRLQYNISGAKIEDVIGVPLTQLIRDTRGGRVEIRTVDSLRLQTTPTVEKRLLIVDEAFQAHYSNGAAAATGFQQVLCVGDPGQIGPVVAVNTRPWEGLATPPHHPFAKVLSKFDDANNLHIDATYRLGQQTTEIVCGFYDFDFVSKRPATHVSLAGAVLPEIDTVVVDRTVPDGTDPALPAMEAVADRVAALVLRGQVSDTDHSSGTVTTRPIEAKDVAVVACLNAQVNMLNALLAARGISDVTAGTADKLQGGEWPVVVTLDPLAGGYGSGHHLHLGRLCVALSRHRSHLTFVTDDGWANSIAAVADSPDAKPADLARHKKIRNMLIAAAQ